MPDMYGNKDVEELVQDQEVLSGTAAVENAIEASMWALDPACKDIFEDITKDLSTANLGMDDLKHVRRYLDLSYLYNKLNMEEDAKFFIRKAYSFCTTSLSFGGFGIKSMHTTAKEIAFRGSPQKPTAMGQMRKKFLGFIPYGR